MADRHYCSIDFIKGICILFVIITHYNFSTAERLRYFFPFWIDMQIPFFMIVSGFVYTKSYLRHNVTTLEVAYQPKNITSKLVRYTVPFAIAFSVEEIALGLLGENNFSILHMGRLFMQGGLGPGSYYYPFMMQFIFLFPLIYMIVQKYDFNGWLICFLLNFFYELLKRVYEMNEDCYRFVILRYFLCMATGCYYAKENYRKDMKRSALFILIGAAYIVCVQYCGVRPLITNYWTHCSFWACLYIIPISAALLTNERLKNPAVELFGKASYHIFLFQMVYYYVGAKFLYQAIESRFLQILANMAICLLGGLLFYFAEMPITYFINQRIRAIAKIQ